MAAELPELAGETLAEFEFLAFEEAVVAVGGAPQEIVERLAAVLDRELERPYSAQAVRRGPERVDGRRQSGHTPLSSRSRYPRTTPWR